MRPALLLAFGIALASTAALAPAIGASAQETGSIHVADAHARPTPPGITTGVVYLVLMNHGGDADTLTGASSPVAASAGLYRSTDQAGVSSMPKVDTLTVKGNDAVTFSAGGLHIMLMGLKQPLKIGDSFPLTLTFAKAGAVDVTVTVQALNPAKAAKPGMKM